MTGERSRRLPGFSGDAAVTLADGRRWYLPAPGTLYLPARDGGAMEAIRAYADRDAMLAQGEALEAEPGLPTARALLVLAAVLLQSNYDLTPAEAVALVRFGDDLPALLSMLAAVDDLARGVPVLTAP